MHKIEMQNPFCLSDRAGVLPMTLYNFHDLQANQMEEKLVKLRQGITLVSLEERQAVEKMYVDMINQWRRRKRMFKDIWDAITENSPKNLKEFKVSWQLIS